MSISEHSHIITEKIGKVQLISISRSEKKNALNLAMYQNLTEAIIYAQECDDIHVLLITGSAGVFTAGNDLSDFMQAKNKLNEKSPILQFMMALKNCQKPVVAAVEGLAVGIGATMLLHCDIVIARADTRFKLPFVSLGLCPEYASSYLLPRVAGHAKASDWLLTGREFSGKEAYSAGLISQLSDDPLTLAKERATMMAALPQKALCRAKLLLNEPLKQTVETVMKKEIELFIKGLMSEEFKHQVMTFFTKSD